MNKTLKHLFAARAAELRKHQPADWADDDCLKGLTALATDELGHGGTITSATRLIQEAGYPAVSQALLFL